MRVLGEVFMFKSIFGIQWGNRGRAFETRQIEIKGMTCRGCVQTIRKALLTKSGVKEVAIDLEGGIATVTFDSTLASLPDLYQVILKKGYFPSVSP
jgi:copper chaperone